MQNLVFKLEFIQKIRAKFYSKVRFDEISGCWEWIGRKDKDGYAKFSFSIFYVTAHRMSFLLHNSNFDDNLVIDHLCRNPSCVNPEHLEQVTQKENTIRGYSFNSKKTHCPQGHPYEGDNLIIVNN